MARLKKLQSVLNREVEKVHQQFREAKERANNATDIRLGGRTVAEEAHKKAEAHLERVSRFGAGVFALRSALVPAQTEPPATAPTSPPSAAPAQNPSVAAASPAVPAPPRPIGLVAPVGWNSVHVSAFPAIFDEFREENSTLLGAAVATVSVSVTFTAVAPAIRTH
jgi:hypothetical protein